MRRSFWLRLWFDWALWVSVCGVLAGLGASAVLCAGLYVYQGMPALVPDILGALLDVAGVAFGPGWGLGVVFGLISATPRLFGRCHAHRKLVLLDCEGEPLPEPVRLEQTLRLWRKWLFAMIWAVSAQVLVGAGIAWALGMQSVMGWFSVYWLYGFLLLAALATLPLMGSRCRMVRVAAC